MELSVISEKKVKHFYLQLIINRKIKYNLMMKANTIDFIRRNTDLKYHISIEKVILEFLPTFMKISIHQK